MPESVAAVGAYFGAGAGTAATAAATETAVGSVAAEAATAGAVEAGTAATVGGGLLSQLGKTAGQAAVTAGASGVVSSLLAPKRPDLPKPTAMPDPLAQEEARKRSIIEQMARRGRASTIMTDAAPDSGGKLGG